MAVSDRVTRIRDTPARICRVHLGPANNQLERNRSLPQICTAMATKPTPETKKGGWMVMELVASHWAGARLPQTHTNGSVM